MSIEKEGAVSEIPVIEKPWNREEGEGARLLHELEQTGAYVFHGSTTADIAELEIRQPYDYTNDIKQEHGAPCVAASRSADVAIFRALVTDDYTGIEAKDGDNILLRASQKASDAARERKGFVYVISKDSFTQFGAHAKMEWRSSTNQKPVQIIEVTEKDLPKDIELIHVNEAKLDNHGIQELNEKDLQPIESESDVIEDAEHKILSKEEMTALVKRHGFTEGSHGTFSDKEHTIFLYIKNKFRATNQKGLEEKLDILRTLTKQGILYPETRWGTFNDGEQLQIFAVTRALQQISPMDDIADAEGSFYNRKKIEGILGEDAPKEDQDNLLLTSPDSHITRWFRRIDPEYDPAEGPKGEYVRILNWVEASHTDNWGFDIQSNTFYPIDVEVIDLPMYISQENSIHDI